jgi:hypothetical protein
MMRDPRDLPRDLPTDPRVSPEVARLEGMREDAKERGDLDAARYWHERAKAEYLSDFE